MKKNTQYTIKEIYDDEAAHRGRLLSQLSAANMKRGPRAEKVRARLRAAVEMSTAKLRVLQSKHAETTLDRLHSKGKPTIDTAIWELRTACDCFRAGERKLALKILRAVKKARTLEANNWCDKHGASYDNICDGCRG